MSKNKAVGDSITGLVALLCVVAFLLVGFTTGQWSPTWVIFLLIPVTSTIVSIARGKKDVQGAVTGVVALLATAGFLLIGFLMHAWHPGWLIFFAIPISGIIVKMATGGQDQEKPPANEGQ
jgi:hypothetical protein